MVSLKYQIILLIRGEGVTPQPQRIGTEIMYPRGRDNVSILKYVKKIC